MAHPMAVATSASTSVLTTPCIYMPAYLLQSFPISEASWVNLSMITLPSAAFVQEIKRTPERIRESSAAGQAYC